MVVKCLYGIPILPIKHFVCFELHFTEEKNIMFTTGPSALNKHSLKKNYESICAWEFRKSWNEFDFHLEVVNNKFVSDFKKIMLFKIRNDLIPWTCTPIIWANIKLLQPLENVFLCYVLIYLETILLWRGWMHKAVC